MIKKAKQRDSVIIVAIITTIGLIIVAYINGCFSSKAALNSNSTAKNNDTIISNTTEVKQSANQSNNKNSNQYNSGRDIIITPPIISNEKKENKENKEKKEKKDTDTAISIKDNKGIVNIGGTSNVYNQTVNQGNVQRTIEDKEVKELIDYIDLNVPRKFQFMVETTFGDNETFTLGKNVDKKLNSMGFKTPRVRQSMFPNPNEGRRVFLEKGDDSTILFVIQPRLQ